MRIEVHPGTGGRDASSFAAELATLIADRHNGTVTSRGGALTVVCL